MVKPRRLLLAASAFALTFLLLVAVTSSPRKTDPARPGSSLIGSPAAATTSRTDLERTVRMMDERLRTDPADTVSAVTLAAALLRQTRVTGNAGLALRAEEAVRRALDARPDDYEARRMLVAILLSEHRFRDAIEEAAKAQRMRPADAANYGAIGDAHLELGEYDEAFAAFDRMMELRPSAAAYARVSYAHELRGDLQGALRLMQMSADATSPDDPESLAWHEAQLGNIALQLDRLDAARRHFEKAAFIFPDHPFAIEGLCRVFSAEGQGDRALETALRQFKQAATPTLAVQIGDLYTKIGRAADAERYFAIAESIWRLDQPEPAALARFLAERDRNIPEAVALATEAASQRDDIFTNDSLAWALYKAGNVREALAASRRALRTGSRDRQLLAHAAAIREAAGRL